MINNSKAKVEKGTLIRWNPLGGSLMAPLIDGSFQRLEESQTVRVSLAVNLFLSLLFLFLSFLNSLILISFI